jgi:hypothetical protein
MVQLPSSFLVVDILAGREFEPAERSPGGYGCSLLHDPDDNGRDVPKEDPRRLVPCYNL